LNPLIDIHHIKSMINKCWFQLKFHYKELKLLPSNPINHNIYLAGGFYTNYINGMFAKEFPILTIITLFRIKILIYIMPMPEVQTFNMINFTSK
jgi:hypothetical protein